ncbi:WW domain binding protein 1-like a [Chanos chanos]|uniref:WW domain binding protein 1-like a n=1 Tax=Chanos chanos TaxID=29144 RepID=A0A6J2V2I7_CHACN|nr:WW domain binding protein 1-like [Chanos chanos]
MWGMGETLCLVLKMGLFLLNAVGSVSSVSAEGAGTEGRLRCLGVNNQSYYCDSGHCCGEAGCCSYYYELWWFWLVWTIIIILSCCCVCHHRRTKHRLQQQQRQHEINLIAYREAHNYTSLPFYFRFLPSYLLPAYEEVENRPATPPPPYSASQPGQSPGAGPLSPEQRDELCPSLQVCPSDPECESSSSGHCVERSHSPSPLCPGQDACKPYVDIDEARQSQHIASAIGVSTTPKPANCRKEFSQLGEQCQDGCLDLKDRMPGRHRRFTGDSGIEVCVCSRGAGEGEEEEEMKELEGLLDREGLEVQDFCDSCNPRGADSHGSEVEERGVAPPPERGPEQPEPPLAQRMQVCLHLHTINEQEAHHHGNSTENQS